MANYFFNPNDYALDTDLKTLGWTERWSNPGTDSWLIKEPVAGVKVIQYTKASASTGRVGLSWDVIDGDAGRADVEALFVARSSESLQTSLRTLMRASGAAGAETGYTPGLTIGANVGYTFNGYVGGTPETVKSGTEISGPQYLTWIAHRVRINGNSFYSKTWVPADPANPVADEPAGWVRTGTSTAISAAGWVGLFRFDHGNHEIRALAFATGGDTATFTAGGDTTAPTLTSPTASATGATTASGSVTTDEANGTLYYLATANASESVATVKAGSSQAVSASGVQNVTLTGLTASTSYYLHFVHTDAAANDSTVATSAQFTTSAAGDTTPPTLTGPTGTATGATTASGTVSTNEDTGTIYWLASANASETGTAVKAGSSQAVSAVGTQNVTVSGLTASTAYYLHYLHRDAAGNDSDVATSAQFTTSAAPDTTAPTLTGSVTFASITQTTYTAQWPAGSDNVAVTGYEYQIGSTAGAWTDAGNNLSAAITGRTAGTTETVYVRAYDAAGLRSTPAISGSVTLESALAAGINVTEPLKNNTGTVLASQSGVRVAVLQAADLVSVYETSGLTTNGSGILATISDTAIIPGRQYHVVIKLADGGIGITGPITAS